MTVSFDRPVPFFLTLAGSPVRSPRCNGLQNGNESSRYSPYNRRHAAYDLFFKLGTWVLLLTDKFPVRRYQYKGRNLPPSMIRFTYRDRLLRYEAIIVFITELIKKLLSTSAAEMRTAGSTLSISVVPIIRRPVPKILLPRARY